jgi:hypothetical protein
VIAAASVLVAAVLIAISAIDPGRGDSVPPWAALPTNRDIDKRGGTNPGPGPAPPPPAAGGGAGLVEVNSAAGLVDALEKANSASVALKLAPGVYDLTDLDRPLQFDGDRLELNGSLPAGMSAPTATIVRLSATALRPALSFKAATVSLGGIHFEIAAAEGAAGMAAPTDPGIPSVLQFETPRLVVADCEFVWPSADRNSRQATIGALAAAGRPRLSVERCVFAGGRVGLRVPTAAEVTIEDSGFGPHAAAIQVRPADAAASDAVEPGPLTQTTVSINRSSFVLDGASAVVEAESRSRPELLVSAGSCVFALDQALPNIEVPGFLSRSHDGTVVRLKGEPEPTPALRFKGVDRRANAYFRAVPFATDSRSYSFEECKSLGFSIEDDGRRILSRRPWEAQEGLLAALGGPSPWQAFRLRVKDSDPDPGLFDADAGTRVLGARFVAPSLAAISGGRAYPDVSWPPREPEPARVTTRVWVPGAVNEEDLSPNESNNLAKLLLDARSGDTILIRHNGLYKVPDQYEIKPPKPANGSDRGEFHLTFKPDAGCRPVLTPDAINKLDLSLFRVIEGRVTFENLEFQVKPALPGYQETVAAVTLVAGRSCTFRNCVFTIQEEDGRSATAVALSDPDREMKMEAPGMRPIPRIAFENCLIRGKGRVVSIPVSRPFALDMDQSLTAMYGPVVFARAGGRETGAAGPSTVRLSRVTALLGGPLIELHGGRIGEMRSSGLVPTNVTADGCLFAGVPGAGRGIVEIDGTELDPMDPNRILRWDRGDPNRFANFDTPVVYIRPGDGSTQEWDWNSWISFAREVGRPVGKVFFAEGPTGPRELATIEPEDATVKEIEFPDLVDPKPGDAGADPGRVARPQPPVPEE